MDCLQIDPQTDLASANNQAVKTCQTQDGLHEFGKPGTELVIWERSLPACLSRWLDQTSIDNLPDLRLLLAPYDLKPALGPLLDECGLVDTDLCRDGNGDRPLMRDLLLSDIQTLVDTFAAVTGSHLVDVRLERIEDDACWKFHRDSVDARLLTTYHGPATQWVPLHHAEQALKDQRAYAGTLEQLGANDVALFKGNNAAGSSGVVLRSPPISGSGDVRLLLCLNQPSVVSPERWPYQS